MKAPLLETVIRKILGGLTSSSTAYVFYHNTLIYTQTKEAVLRKVCNSWDLLGWYMFQQQPEVTVPQFIFVFSTEIAYSVTWVHGRSISVALIRN
jgi:hypothetical protein